MDNGDTLRRALAQLREMGWSEELLGVLAENWETENTQEIVRFALRREQTRQARLVRVRPPRRAPFKPYRKSAIPRALAKAVFERDAYRCRHCGGWVDLTVDHIIPESKGGKTESENLQTLCRSCNSRKGTRT